MFRKEGKTSIDKSSLELNQDILDKYKKRKKGMYTNLPCAPIKKKSEIEIIKKQR